MILAPGQLLNSPLELRTLHASGLGQICPTVKLNIGMLSPDGSGLSVVFLDKDE